MLKAGATDFVHGPAGEYHFAKCTCHRGLYLLYVIVHAYAI